MEEKANFAKVIKTESFGRKDKMSTMVEEVTALSLFMANTSASDNTSVIASSARAKWAIVKSQEESMAVRTD